VAPSDQLTFLLDAHDLLDQAQRLAAASTAAPGCVPPCDFITPLAYAVTDVLGVVIAAAPGSTTSTMVSLALGAGAMSQCGGATGESLRDALRADLEVRIQNLLADDAQNDPIWELELLDVAVTAQMLGVDSIGPGGLSPSDIFVLLGAS
jgi:hypothetical protein